MGTDFQFETFRGATPHKSRLTEVKGNEGKCHFPLRRDGTNTAGVIGHNRVR